MYIMNHYPSMANKLLHKSEIPSKESLKLENLSKRRRIIETKVTKYKDTIAQKKGDQKKQKTKLDKAEAEVTVIKRDHEKLLNNPKKRKHIEQSIFDLTIEQWRFLVPLTFGRIFSPRG